MLLRPNDRFWKLRREKKKEGGTRGRRRLDLSVHLPLFFTRPYSSFLPRKHATRGNARSEVDLLLVWQKRQQCFAALAFRGGRLLRLVLPFPYFCVLICMTKRHPPLSPSLDILYTAFFRLTRSRATLVNERTTLLFPPTPIFVLLFLLFPPAVQMERKQKTINLER